VHNIPGAVTARYNLTNIPGTVHNIPGAGPARYNLTDIPGA